MSRPAPRIGRKHQRGGTDDADFEAERRGFDRHGAEIGMARAAIVARMAGAKRSKAEESPPPSTMRSGE